MIKMSFIRKNKFVIIAIAVFLILVIVAFQVVNMFFPEEGKALYGDRLDGIEEVELTDKKLESIASSIEEDAAVKNAEVSVAGKIVEVIITVQDDTSTDTAKGLNTKVLESLDDDEKKFYDIQIFLTKETDANDFPIIGYKHHSKDSFSWTKDREAE